MHCNLTSVRGAIKQNYFISKVEMESRLKAINSKSIRDQSEVSGEKQYHRGSPHS